MKLKILIVIALQMFSTASWAVDGTAKNERLDTVDRKLELIENNVKEIRRDQLNYKIEKDLLKETYSSNLETVNVVITLILGTFTVLAFFGIRSVGATRKEFRQELEQLREVRSRSEDRLREIEIQQNHSKERLEEIASINTDQNQRLKLLEILELAGSRINRKQYSHALDYITIGLDADPKNVALLRYREFCLLRLKRFDEAIETMEQTLELEPTNAEIALNLCEILRLMKRTERLFELEARYSGEINKRPHLSWLFEAIDLYREKKDEELEVHIKNLLKSLPEKEHKHTDWEFDECREFLENEDKRPITEVLFKTFRVLSGDLLPSAVIQEEDTNSSENVT